MEMHLKSLIMNAKIEGKFIEKVLIDGGSTINILPKTMLKRLSKKIEDIVPQNIMVSDFNGRVSNIEGIICLNVKISSDI